MRSVALHVLAATLLVAFLAARESAAYDVVDDLFRLDASSSAAEPGKSPDATPRAFPAVQSVEVDAADAAARIDEPYSVQSWESDRQGDVIEAADHPSSAPHRPGDRSYPVGPVNAVPEPSAMILAVAALVYFLLFGRRRRMV